MVLYDDGDNTDVGVAANMEEYAADEAAASAVDRAIQTHGGAGLSADYGLAAMLGNSRLFTHRPGQPRDDPQLHLTTQPRPTQVLLSFQ